MFFILVVANSFFVGVVNADYREHPQLADFINQMEKKHGFVKDDLLQLFGQVDKKQKIIDAISRPAEKTLTWAEYRNIFIKPDRIEKGVVFWKENKNTLERAEKEFGVPPEVVVAIIGVETRYGSNTGSYRVIDALSTLGFDYPPRATFFKKELENFLLLSREQKQDPLTLTGSYAGAMGYGQFMPSSYRAYSVDFDGDDFNDIWNNPVDAIGSVANYFKRHGWEQGKPVVISAKATKGFDKSILTSKTKLNSTVEKVESAGFLPVARLEGGLGAMAFKLEGDSGDEYWMGLKNFYVITRYNHSLLYAMAVHQLSEKIKASFPKEELDLTVPTKKDI
ncbi:MAG: lytic murein transglycosylase B [Cellvibrionaceae bacterium]